jgi:hypothetical protein
MDFRTALEAALKNAKVTDNTIATYVRILKSLNGGQEPSNLDFLSDYDTVEGRLVNKDNGKGTVAETTIKNRLIAVLKTVNAMQGTNNDVYKHYKTKFDKLSGKLLKVAKSGVKSDKEKANWLGLPELMEILDAKKAIAQKPGATRSEKLDYFILSLFIDLDAGRLQEYTEMYLVFKPAEYNPDFNYLIVPEHKLKLTIHKTVNKKGYLEKSFANKPAFIEALNTYLTAFDAKRKKKPIRMLLDSDGSAMSPDNLRYRLHKIIGKPISSQMLRKITASAKAPPKKELVELAERAAAMGHDLQTHINYYVKN